MGCLRTGWTALLLLSFVLTPDVLVAGTQTQRPDAGAAATEEIRRLVEALRDGSGIQVAGVALPPDALLASIYEQRGFVPIWTDVSRAASLRSVVDGVRADGLDPERYHRSTLETLRSASTARELAEADLLRSAILVRIARDLHFGRVDPSVIERGWNVDRPADVLTPELLLRVMESADPASALATLRPTHFVYIGLQRALAHYRGIAERGGWVTIVDGPPLALDSVHPDVRVLRQRLLAEGDLAPHADAASTRFDQVLDSAVRRFQHRHALNEDGVVGAATRRALNVPVETRIDQIRLNLERARWVLHGLADTFVAVNTAGQRVYLVRNGDVVWETRAIVGAQYTRTPIFSAPMRYLVLNPTWTVPASINREVLAALRRNPAYLARQNMSVLDAAGRRLDPRSIDFTAWSGRDFPYVFRQEPGDLNALGRIKFMFPNSYNVYLHDTPARSLFDREVRTFSHGCVRVQDPLRLAELLLDDTVNWSRADLELAIATGETRTVNLPTPIPTLVLYWTASTDLHGEVHFYGDPYGRDEPLLRALNGS